MGTALVRYGVPRSELAIVDPWPQLMHLWNQRIDNCGMHFLRSPAAHGILPEFTSLRRWARTHGYVDNTNYRPPYARPSVPLFRAYAEWAVEHSGVSASHIRGTVRAISRVGDSWEVQTDAGLTVITRHVILATGRTAGDGEPLLRSPQWATGIPAVRHVLDAHFDRGSFLSAASPVVVGAGATAVHLAVSLGRAGRHVRLLTRDHARIHQFDSEPCFIGPECYQTFLQTEELSARRSLIRDARHPGSIPEDLFRELQEQRSAGRVELILDEITQAGQEPRGVVLRGRNALYRSDAVALGTGFRSDIPSAGLLDQIEDASDGPLSRESTGMPVPDETLQWTRRLYLTGSLAELELGPTAPNIIGAHNAAKRIVSHLSGAAARIPRSWRSYFADADHAPESSPRSAGPC